MKWNLNNYILPNNKIDFDKMELDFAFVKDLINCVQGVKYHSEGNVWIHTKMSLECLLDIKEYQELDEKEKSIVFLAVLLHDIGKPYTTKEEEDQITSKKHSVVGARKSREILWGLNSYLEVSWDVRENVSNLILLHMLPVYFLNKQDPFYSVYASSYVIKNKWLYILSLADSRGRICLDEKDKETAEEAIELFSMFCKENGCYENEKSFPSVNAKFRYFFERNGSPDFDRFEEDKGEVIIMSGLSGSGKSYDIKKLYNSLQIIGLDETRGNLDLRYGEDEDEVLRSAKEQCKELMRKNINFVFNATNLVKDRRSKWIRLFRQYGYKITIHYVEKTLKQTLKQNKNREAVVPESVILERFERIDIPTQLECHNLILNVPKEEIC